MMTPEEQRINDLEAEQARYDIARECEADDNAAREAYVMGLLHQAALTEDNLFGIEAGVAVYADLADEDCDPGYQEQ